MNDSTSENELIPCTLGDVRNIVIVLERTNYDVVAFSSPFYAHKKQPKTKLCNDTQPSHKICFSCFIQCLRAC